jgi:hypothetical protein
MKGCAHRLPEEAFAKHVVEADQPLLRRLAVGVLDERRQELQGVAMGQRRAALWFDRQNSAQPSSSPSLLDFHDLCRASGARSSAGIEETLAGALALIRDRIGRAAPAQHLDRIHTIRAKAERPEETGGGHFAVHLAVCFVVFDLDAICGRACIQLAPEFWACS